jgi:sugar phosphate isomerase/epimerase
VKARLGINTCFAVKRWPEPGDWARIVRDELGLDTVEVSLDLIEDLGSAPGREKAASQARSALDEYGLRAETGFTGVAAYSLNLLMHPGEERRRAAREWYLGVVDLAARVGARGAGGHVGAMSVPDRDPYAWLTHFGSRLAEVQLQQSDGLGDHHWPFTPERNETGLIDPARVLDTLAEAGADDVLLVLEVIPAFEQDDAEVLSDLRASAELWRAALTERGA